LSAITKPAALPLSVNATARVTFPNAKAPRPRKKIKTLPQTAHERKKKDQRNYRRSENRSRPGFDIWLCVESF
jgi:hypothetical protein